MAISRTRSSGANGHSTKRLSVRSASVKQVTAGFDQEERDVKTGRQTVSEIARTTGRNRRTIRRLIHQGFHCHERRDW